MLIRPRFRRPAFAKLARWAAPVLMVLAGCSGPRPGAVPPPAAPPEATDARAVLGGTIVLRPRDAVLPSTAIVKVWLQDMSRPNLPVPEIVEEQVISPPGPVPIAFKLRYDPAAVDPARSYTILVRIYEGDRLRYTNVNRYPVLTQGCKADCEVIAYAMY